VRILATVTCVVWLAAWPALAAAGAKAPPAPAPAPMAWPIPAVAWRVPIGSVGRGVPLGGVGTGSAMLDTGGSFGPWHFKPGSPEPDRRLAGAAFHFYQKPAGQPAQVTTLTARRAMPAWNTLPPGSGFYHALFPKGWFTWRCFQADLSLKFFSPIIRGNVKETSYPVAIFEFVVSNPTEQPLDVALLFSFPNAAGHTADLRSGFVNVAERDEANRIRAVVLDANHEHNHAAAQDTEWCIAVRAEHDGELTYVPSWNAIASGGDLLAEFADDGRLPNEALDATDSAAAVAFRTRLAPKATVTVPFALSWDFPRVSFGPTLWWRRYTEHVGRSADNAFAIARTALLHHGEWEAAVDAWTRPILDEPAYPDWLKQAALNELYYDVFGGTFWEAGCITDPREFKGLHPDDHKYFALASPTQPLCEPLALRGAASPHLLALWPQIERDVLTTYADLILDAPTSVVHDLGTPSDNPFFAYNASRAECPAAKDLPALFILQAHACARATSDREFLDHVWPACLRCVEPLLKGDGLPRHEGHDVATAPCALQGISLRCGGLWVAAFEALEQMATERGDARATTFAALARRARATLDRELWRPRLRYYAIDTHSRRGDALSSGALAGLHYAQAAGLEPILPLQRVHSHLRRVFRRCVRPLRDYTGDGVGDVGAVNVVGRDGRPVPACRGREVSLADTYRLAATMVAVGRRKSDDRLVAAALKTAYGAYYHSWVLAPDKPLWAFNTPQAWHADNPARARATQHCEPRAIWALLLALKNPFAPAPAPAVE